MSRRVLVTGATGFVGSAVARAFIDAGYRVRALVRAHSSRNHLEGLDVEEVVGDLADAESLDRAVAGCQGLAHVAADYRLFVRDAAPMYRINVDGTRKLMQAALAAGTERIVYTSSVAVLGHRPDNAPANETTSATLEDMVGNYKRSKHMAEAAVFRLVAESGLPAVVVNPTAPVGPRDAKPTPTGRMVLDAARGRMFACLDTGLNIVHVDDVARGHVQAYERARVGERYIFGGDNLSLAEIFGTITMLAGRRPPRLRLRPGSLVPLAWVAESWARLRGTTPRLTRDELAMARQPMFFSSAKAERELGYTHRPAATAIADAVAWYASTGRLRLAKGAVADPPALQASHGLRRGPNR